MKVKFNPNITDMLVLKSLSEKDRKELLKKGLDVNKLEKSIMINLKKANPVAGNPVAGREIDRSNLVPIKETVTRNGRQQLTTVWVNPDKKDEEKENSQVNTQNQADEQNQADGGASKNYISPDGTKVSLKPTGNGDFPYTVTVTDNTGKREIKRIASEKLAQQEIKNLVGNLDEASDRARTKAPSKSQS